MLELILAGNGLSVVIVGFFVGAAMLIVHEFLVKGRQQSSDADGDRDPTEMLLPSNIGDMVDFSGVPPLTQNFRLALMVVMVIIVIGMIWNAIDLIWMAGSWLFGSRDADGDRDPTEMLLPSNIGDMVDFSGVPPLTQNFRLALMVVMVIIVIGMIWNAIDLISMAGSWLFGSR